MGAGSGFGSITPPTSSTAGYKRDGDGDGRYGGKNWHQTPPVAFILGMGVYTNVRILEFVGAVYGVAWEDLWLNTLVFCGAVSFSSFSPHPSPPSYISLPVLHLLTNHEEHY